MYGNQCESFKGKRHEPHVNEFSMFLTATTTRHLVSRILKPCCVRRCYSSSATLDVVESDIVIVGGGPVGLALASALCEPYL
jgi:ribulose 1,5-bisphosphate synthetase/thiazole synthase